jgi:hypothetical protein
MNETHPDGYLNPGETAGLRITVKNFGITGQNNVTGTLTTSNPYITILDGNASFGNIVSNGSATGDFSLSVEADAPTASAVDFTLVLSSSVSNYQSKFSLLLDGIDLQIEEVSLPGGPINPGAQGDVEITLVNNGAFPASGVTAELSSFDEAVTILDGSANYGDIPSGQTVSNSDPLRIQIGEDAYEGRIIQLRLLTSPSVGAEKTLTFNITVGTPESDDPTGPDPYGYFAYDDTDVDYSSVPAFNWAELDPDYGGVGGAVPIFMQDDSSIQVDLPFNFKFYGETYNIVTICSNGWVSFADTWSEIFRNWDLPSPEGPPTLVAAFWDDLKDSTDTGWMHIYYWYDSAGDRFIVEWSRVLNCFLNAPQRIETFEVILYDPQSTHHGPTGDGDILVQLLQVNDIDETNNFCTIGIEDYYHTRGLEYIYAKDYANHPTSDSLRSNMAILFTTTPPDDYAGVNDNEGNVLSRFSLSPNYPNPFNPSTIINFELGRDEMVNLTIYDISGRVVRSLASGEFTAGMHIVEWDGNGDASNPLSSGIYFIQLKAGDFKATNKCVLIK